MVAPVCNDQFPLTFANLKMPLVVVGSTFRQPTISYVDVDNFGASAAITEYLVKLGHKKIGFLRGPSDLRDAAQREQAFRKTLMAHHLPVMEKWILQGDYGTRRAFHLALDLLSNDNRPTAIFAANDLMAYGVLDAARVLRLKVPEDVSVVGFDDLEGSAECVPSLTTATQPMKQLGQVAASYLMRRLDGRDKSLSLHQKLPVPLVVRGSTAPPAQKFHAADLGVLPLRSEGTYSTELTFLPAHKGNSGRLLGDDIDYEPRTSAAIKGFRSSRWLPILVAARFLVFCRSSFAQSTAIHGHARPHSRHHPDGKLRPRRTGRRVQLFASIESLPPTSTAQPLR